MNAVETCKQVKTVVQLLKQYSMGERSFSQSILNGADLRQHDLENIILSNSTLLNINLEKANLSGADFSS
ncbi:MAG: pentapeptide repeat-containing protein [Cyanobacteria bacterium P01_E01_bin.45]